MKTINLLQTRENQLKNNFLYDFFLSNVRIYYIVSHIFFFHMVIVSHELVSSYESNIRIFSIHHMNQNFLFHMDDTHHMKTNICETIVKIKVFDEKNHVKNIF